MNAYVKVQLQRAQNMNMHVCLRTDEMWCIEKTDKDNCCKY